MSGLLFFLIVPYPVSTVFPFKAKLPAICQQLFIAHVFSFPGPAFPEKKIKKEGADPLSENRPLK